VHARTHPCYALIKKYTLRTSRFHKRQRGSQQQQSYLNIFMIAATTLSYEDYCNELLSLWDSAKSKLDELNSRFVECNSTLNEGELRKAFDKALLTKFCKEHTEFWIKVITTNKQLFVEANILGISDEEYKKKRYKTLNHIYSYYN
jgi:hypothetical protein